MMPKHIFLVVFITLLLAGCKQELSYSYLMEHPMVLKQELDKCQSGGENSNASQCNTVMAAATQFQALLNDMQQDPEKFGQHILDEEILCIKLKEDWQRAKQLAKTDDQAAQAKLKEAEKAYQDQREKVKRLLAVVGIGSPE